MLIIHHLYRILKATENIVFSPESYKDDKKQTYNLFLHPSDLLRDLRGQRTGLINLTVQLETHSCDTVAGVLVYLSIQVLDCV